MESLDLTIAGMSCGHCAASVRRALESTEGISVDGVQIGSAAVQYDPSRVTPADIVARVADAGYQASVAEATAESR